MSISERMSSELLNTPLPVESVPTINHMSSTRIATTLPMVQKAYTDACGTITRLRERADRRRERQNTLINSISVHSAYMYRLANVVTLLTEGLPLSQSTVPSAIPEACRGVFTTPEALLTHLDALAEALETNVIRAMSSPVGPQLLESREEETPHVASLELVRADAEMTLSNRLVSLSFPTRNVLLSPLILSDNSVSTSGAPIL